MILPRHSKVLLLFIFLISIFNGHLFAQTGVKKMIEKHSAEFKNVTTLSPFNISLQKNTIAEEAIKGNIEFFNLNPELSINLLKQKNQLLKLSIPTTDGVPYVLDLKKVDVLTPTFILNAASNKEKYLDHESALFYWGVVEGNNNSIVAINIYDDEISGTINIGNASFTLGKIKDSNQHILYREIDVIEKGNPKCFTSDAKANLNNQIEAQAKSMLNPDNCVRLYVEVDYDLFLEFGTITDTYNYIAGALSQVAIMYANESINITLNQMLVWDMEDPYTGTDTGNLLTMFTSLLAGNFNGDLGHLIGIKGGGGIARLNALCNSVNKCAYSGINTSYANVPSYSWTINVLTHEIGHNLGSPHTHSCSWNGNNTQIDDCGNVNSSSPPTCFDANNPILPSGGTIMSYCHLVQSIGMDFNLGFGTQPGDLIRNNVYNAACLTTCDPCPTFGDACDDGDPCTIQDAIDSYCNCSGVMSPDNDQDGYCAPLDSDDENPCVPDDCTGCTFTYLTLNTDQYPGETSWEIRDDMGTVIFSGAGYLANSTNLISVCIPNGCYDLVLLDTYGDGFCCAYGDGSYEFSDVFGNIISQGTGEIGSELAINFCHNNDPCTPGAPCTDGDECTTNDIFDSNCFCQGTFADADSDGVCDAEDSCPNGSDLLDYNNNDIADECDTFTPCNNCSTVINSFPHVENFEGTLSICQFTDDDIDWTLQSGGTASVQTGPSTAYEGSNYFYVEASNNYYKNAAFQGACYDLTTATSATIDFWYHMYGEFMGTMSLDISVDNGITYTNVWTQSEDQGDTWINQTVNLSSFIGNIITYRFSGFIDENYTSDMALDLITLDINNVSCSPCSSNSPLPTLAGTYFGAQEVVEGDWTHYCDCEGNLLLSLDKTNATSLQVIPQEVIIKMTPGATYFPGQTGFITNSFGAAFMNCKWEVNPTVQPGIGEEVGVKFYYSDAGYSALTDTLANRNTSWTITSPSELTFYKVVNSTLGDFPEIPNIAFTDLILLSSGTSTTNSYFNAMHPNMTDHYAEFKVTSFSGGGAGAGDENGALPVELSSFSGKEENCDRILFWETSLEINNSLFEIQRSQDGNSFTSIGTVQGNTNSSSVKRYSYIDKNFNISSKLYYRLKQVDVSGSINYSRVILIESDCKTDNFSAYPNPFSNQLQISIEVNAIEKYEELEISIKSLDGSNLITFNPALELGMNSINIPFEDKFPSGIYIVQLNLGWKTISKKVIKMGN